MRLPSAKVTSATAEGQNTPSPFTQNHGQQQEDQRQHPGQRRGGRPNLWLAPPPKAAGRGRRGSELAEAFSQVLADQLRRRVHRERQEKQQDRA